MIFSERLKCLREEKGLTQKELALKCNLSSQCVCALEQGTRSPTATTVKAFANFFNVTTDYLLGLEDDFGHKTVANAGNGYTEEERQIIEDYRALSPNLQRLVRDTINTFTTSDENKQRKEC